MSRQQNKTPLLPYHPEHLDRRDALGGKALREAVYYWAQRERHCERWLNLARQEARNYQQRPDDPEARSSYQLAVQRAAGWVKELDEAREMNRMLQLRVKEGWS